MNSSLTRRQALGALGALALPWESVLAQSRKGSSAAAASPSPVPAAPPRPDLENLHPIIQSIADARPLHLSFLDARWRGIDAWKQAARPFFRERLSYRPKAPAVGADLVRREERDGYSMEVVNLQATSAYKIPARVLVPTQRRGRLPAVVALHSHGGRYTWGLQKLVPSPDDSEALIEARAGSYGGRPWAEALVRRGMIVVAIDAFYFGERRLRVEDMQPEQVINDARDAYRAARAAKAGTPEWHRAISRVCSLYEHLTAKNIFSAGATWPGLHVWDDMRTVDYLLTRPDVDPDRIGCAGLSIGGLRAVHLMGADARIKAACVTGWMTQFARQHRNHLRNHTWMIHVPGVYEAMDFPDIASLIAPGALFVQQCSRDLLYPMEAMRGSVERLTQIYAKAGIPERFRGAFYDEPHCFKPYMQDEAFAWLERWL